jgi:hypothetical protein
MAKGVGQVGNPEMIAKATAVQAKIEQAIAENKSIEVQTDELDDGDLGNPAPEQPIGVIKEVKTYILKKSYKNIGKEVGDYYNGEFTMSIEELLKAGVIEEHKEEELDAFPLPLKEQTKDEDKALKIKNARAKLDAISKKQIEECGK